jgi:hypothetical protein
MSHGDRKFVVVVLSASVYSKVTTPVREAFSNATFSLGYVFLCGSAAILFGDAIDFGVLRR